MCSPVLQWLILCVVSLDHRMPRWRVKHCFGYFNEDIFGCDSHVYQETDYNRIFVYLYIMFVHTCIYPTSSVSLENLNCFSGNLNCFSGKPRTSFLTHDPAIHYPVIRLKLLSSEHFTRGNLRWICGARKKLESFKFSNKTPLGDNYCLCLFIYTHTYHTYTHTHTHTHDPHTYTYHTHTHMHTTHAHTHTYQCTHAHIHTHTYCTYTHTHTTHTLTHTLHIHTTHTHTPHTHMHHDLDTTA